MYAIIHALFLVSNYIFYNFFQILKYIKTIVLHLIVAPQLSSGWQHYSTKTGHAGQVNEQSMYMSMVNIFPLVIRKMRVIFF
jgi:hypothetical protein